MRRAGHVARMEEGRNAFNILTGIPAGKRPLGRTILELILNIITRILIILESHSLKVPPGGKVSGLLNPEKY